MLSAVEPEPLNRAGLATPPPPFVSRGGLMAGVIGDRTRQLQVLCSSNNARNSS